MKKSHEYDSPVLSKLVSVVTVLAICVCSICCIVTASKVSNIATGTVAVNPDNGDSGNQGSQGSQGSQGGQTTTPTTPSGDSSNSDNSGDAQTPSGGDSANSDAPEATGPSYEEILAEYTKIMDDFKKNVADGNVAQYNKKEFQSLADDYDLGTVGNLVLPIAQGLMTSEEEAEEQVRTDYEQIPVTHNIKGCLLTDASAIKTASMTESGGKTTIEIVLNDEKGAYPAEDNATSCGSIVGSMFNPLDQQEIDDIVAEFAGVVTINKFELTCVDCTATLVYDTATGKVESLKQIMNYYIDVDAKAVIVPVSGYATLINDMTIYNVQYK